MPLFNDLNLFNDAYLFDDATVVPEVAPPIITPRPRRRRDVRGPSQLVEAFPMWEGNQIGDPLPVLDGSLTIDGSAPIARQGSLTLIDKDGTLTPHHSSSKLAPYGAELALYGITETSGGWIVARDDFARPDGAIGNADTGQAWRLLGVPGWEVVGGTARMMAPASGNGRGAAVIDTSSPDGRMSVRLRSPRHAGLAMRVIDADNLLTLSVVDDADPGVYVLITRWDNAVATHLAEWTRTSVGSLAVEFDGADITVWADDVEMGTVTLDAADLAKYARGNAHGLYSWAGAGVAPDERFDGFLLRSLTPLLSRRSDPLAVLRIDVTGATMDVRGTVVTVRGQDRAASVAANGFPRTTTVAKGADIVDRIATGINDALPGVDLSRFEEAVYLSPRLLVYEEDADAWDAYRAMAASIGMELFFGRTGVPVLRKVPSVLNTAPVADYVMGTSGVTQIQRTWDAQQGYNRYVVVGADANRNPVRGTWQDTDPSSPTYYGGPFGKRTAPVIHDEKVGSVAQANVAARGYGMRDRGGTEVVEVTSKVDYRRTFGDVVRLVAAPLNLDESAVVEHVNMAMTPGQLMQFRTSAKRTVVEESEA